MRKRNWRELPSAVDNPALDARLDGRPLAVFLDYDGVLTEIVDHPAQAVLTPARRRTVAALAERHPVAVVSGRDLADVRALVGLHGVVYAGSHGFDLDAPGGLRVDHDAEAYLPALDEAQRRLAAELAAVPGAWVERKRYALAVHTRQVADPDLDRVDAAVAAVAATTGRLRRTGGKRVLELRPALPWDKGRAVRWLLEALGLDREGVVPLYLGDDETDEDALAALAGRGVGIVVGEPDFPTAADARLADPDEVQAFLERLVRT